MDAFMLELLDLLKVTPEMTQVEVRADLQALEELWREKLTDTPQY